MLFNSMRTLCLLLTSMLTFVGFGCNSIDMDNKVCANGDVEGTTKVSIVTFDDAACKFKRAPRKTFYDERSLCESPDVLVPIVVHKRPIMRPLDAVTFDHRDTTVDTLFDVANEMFCRYGVAFEHVETVYDEYDTFVMMSDDYNDMRGLADYNKVNWDDGRLHVYIVDYIYDSRKSSTYGGFFYYKRDKCDGLIALRLDSSEKIMAHELGHVFNLDHVEDPTNVMYPRDLTSALGFTDVQGATIAVNAELMTCHCWGGDE